MAYDPRYGVVPDNWTGPQQMPGLKGYGAGASKRGYNTQAEYQRVQDAKRRSRFIKGVVLPVAGVAGVAAAPAIAGAFGGSAAAGGAAGTASAAAPAAAGVGGTFTYSNLLRAAEIGIPAVTNWFGQRSQNRALDRQSQIEQQNYAEQMAFAREQEAYRRAEAERMAAEDQRRWEAEERNRAREIAASDEERAYQRRLMDERESRRAPYRQASQAALFRLNDFINMGRR